VDNWQNAERMAEDDKSRLKLRLPSGLEVEAEGRPDFVRVQIQELLRYAAPPEAKDTRSAPEPEALERILEQTGAELAIRALPPGAADPQEACLVLLLASERRLGLAKPTAAQLAKWLRRSGFSVKRMDRSLSRALRAGQILASGSRRSRRYELSAKGRIQSLLAAERLARSIG
jgi:hypothetical protein